MTTFRALVPQVESRPAGAAPIDQILIATGSAVVLVGLLGFLAIGHRTGRTTILQRLMERSERSPFGRGLAGWASVPLLVALVSLVTALLGMYWDIALHIGVGRDEGPLANPAHYPIMFGLFGISAAGVLACVLPRDERPGPAAVQLSRSLHAPVGGVLLTGAGSYALLGFPLDDVWHRIFGQDVTLWGPTHLMLIGGAGLSLVAMAILYEEGLLQDSAAHSRRERARTYALRSFTMGGMLIGLSVFQAEFDFGVPQFRLVLQPFLIALAAALALVAARLWIGRGGAVAAALFYLAVRGGVSVVVGPVLGELWAAVPLYLAEAVCVEVAVLLLSRRPVAAGVLSGLLIGTVGFWAEFAWTQQVFRLPWTSDIAVEGMTMAVVGGIAGGVCGALLVLGLRGQLTPGRTPALLFGLSILAIEACAANGLVTTRPTDLQATMTVTPVGQDDARATAQFEFTRPPSEGEPAWLTVTSWQGGGAKGLHVDHLHKLSATRYETTESMPISGSWKTMVRLQDGRHIAAMPVFLPADSALDKPEIPATDGAQRPIGNEKVLLQRELKDGVPPWLWLVAGLVVLLCSLVLVLSLGWGTARFSAHRRVRDSHLLRQPASDAALDAAPGAAATVEPAR
jgi:hypothetical protein